MRPTPPPSPLGRAFPRVSATAQSPRNLRRKLDEGISRKHDFIVESCGVLDSATPWVRKFGYL